MKQIFQSLKTGETTLENLPLPICGDEQILVRTTHSLVSLGTEKMLLDFGKAGWLEKARSQPEKVSQVLSKIKTDGLMPTLEAVQRKLDQPLPLGYTAVGVVEKVGRGVAGFEVGDRVITNGPHSQFVVVSKNLAARIPDDVSSEDAAFTVIGAIGLQGVRLLQPTFGETFVVVGLGLIGLLTTQILLSNGCDVIGFDFDESKVNLARKYGAQAFALSDIVDPVTEALNLTGGRGVDGVVITASTSSNEVISQSARMTRKRGRVVLVGVTGLDLKRSDFYEKEISFQVSCSYGPGRYDSAYEERGLDYPIGFVRWTEARNFEAVLRSIEKKQILVSDLITSRVSFENAPGLYAQLGERKGELGVLLEYGNSATLASTVKVLDPSSKGSERSISFLGAGQFAGAVLLPAFRKNGFSFYKLGSRTGVVGAHLARKYSFQEMTSNYQEILEDAGAKNIAISTRHNSHGRLVLEALQKGKNVFVEKPLALTETELDSIENFFDQEGRRSILMVGFNRRFSPMVREIKKVIDQTSCSKAYVMTVNAGALPQDHWTQNREVGGGRLVGEACHFIDLLRSLSGSAIKNGSVVGMNGSSKDTFSIQLKFENGDIGTIHYFANGNKNFPKERLEIFVGGKIILMDNFRKVKGIGLKSLKFALSSQDKGHEQELKIFGESVASGEQPVPLDEILEVSRWSVRLQNELHGAHGNS